MNDILLTPIIPTYNRKEYLRIVLNCLLSQKCEGCRILPVVVVDGSTDGTLEMLQREYPIVEIIKGDGQWWYTRCINEGIKKALALEADYILTLNDDIEFDENYLSFLFQVLKNEGNNCIVGSASFTRTLPHRITFSGVRKTIKWRMKDMVYFKKYSIVDKTKLYSYKPSVNLSGRGILIPVELIKKIGCYDEKFVQYGSDTDFTYRASKAGVKVFISYDACIYENERMTSQGIFYNKPTIKEFFTSYLNPYSINSYRKSIYYYKKHGLKFLLPLYLLIIIIGIFHGIIRIIIHKDF